MHSRFVYITTHTHPYLSLLYNYNIIISMYVLYCYTLIQYMCVYINYCMFHYCGVDIQNTQSWKRKRTGNDEEVSAPSPTLNTNTHMYTDTYRHMYT